MSSIDEKAKHAVNWMADKAKDLVDDAKDAVDGAKDAVDGAEEVADEVADKGATTVKDQRKKVGKKLKDLGDKFSGS